MVKQRKRTGGKGEESGGEEVTEAGKIRIRSDEKYMTVSDFGQR